MPATPAVPPASDSDGPDSDGPESKGPESKGPERLTVRSVEDLIALVPVVIGFEPEESLTLLSFAARPPGRTFHARVDLPPVRGRPAGDHSPEGTAGTAGADGADGPPEPAALREMVRSLTEPVVAHRVSLCALVIHSRRPVLAAAVARRTAQALAGGNSRSPRVRLVGCLRAHDRRWFRLPGPQDLPGPGAAEGVPYDVSLHPFVLRSVVAGRVLHASRAALAASLDPDPPAVDRVRTRTAGRSSSRGSDEETWARAVVGSAVGRRVPLAADDGARLLHGMLEIRVRDAAWSTMTRATAPQHVALWTDLVRRAPSELLAAPGSLLAFAAWLAGDGALAWCALDRVGAADPDYPLAGLVAAALERACDPDIWRHDGSVFEGTDGAGAQQPSGTTFRGGGGGPPRPCPRGPDGG